MLVYNSPPRCCPELKLVNSQVFQLEYLRRKFDRLMCKSNLTSRQTSPARVTWESNPIAFFPQKDNRLTTTHQVVHRGLEPRSLGLQPSAYPVKLTDLKARGTMRTYDSESLDSTFSLNYPSERGLNLNDDRFVYNKSCMITVILRPTIFKL